MPAFTFDFKRTALVALAGLVTAKGQTTSESIAFCRARAISDGAAVMQNAYTEAWVDIGHYVCGDLSEEPAVVEIDTQVRDVAFAIAEAFAEVSINCFASGNADVRATAYALSEQRAEALGSAVSEIFAATDVCGECSASVSALSNTTMTLIAEAVAEAWTEVLVFSDAGADVPVEEQSSVTSLVIVETIADILSSITGSIRAAANDGCSIDAINEVQVGDFLARCELATSGGVREISVDAVTMAGAEASAFACSGNPSEAEATVDVIARATASALAEAIAQADVFCEANGGPDTRACGLAEADVRAAASAQADAFATAFASAEACGCNVSVSAQVSVWDEIWVEAVANAYAETCVTGTGEDFVTEFTFAMEERMLTSTARAIASAIAEADELQGSQCLVSLDVCTSNSPMCVERSGEQCGGRGFEFVLPCCDPEHLCFRQNANIFRCRNRNARLPSFWDGTIEDCTLPQP